MYKVVFVVILSLFSSVAVAIERHALIIGNSAYAENALVNPVNDANDMAVQLQKMGYKIHGGAAALDLDRVGIESKLQAFARQLPKDAHALFYYAGHGMAVEQDNYLIPINHNLKFQEQLPDRTVSLRSIVNLLKNANPDGINVVLLDACRDNPLQRSFRSTRAGLNRLNDFPRGVFIGYAADSGQVAADGYGRNGIYTGELLNVLREKPDIIVELAHKAVSARVFDKTNGRQFPVSENKVYGNWCFGNCAAAIVTTTNEQKPAVEPSPTKSRRPWIIAGGVVLGAVLVGLATRGSSGSSESGSSTFVLELRPPE